MFPEEFLIIDGCRADVAGAQAQSPGISITEFKCQWIYFFARCLVLRWWFLTGHNLPPGEHLAMLGDILGCHTAGVLLIPSAQRPQMLYTSHNSQASPTERESNYLAPVQYW